jgi:hypothetical protein
MEHVRDELANDDRQQSLNYETNISHRETMTGRRFAESSASTRRIKGAH